MAFLSTFLLMCMISCAALQQSLPNIGRWWIVAVDFTFTFCHFFFLDFFSHFSLAHPTGSTSRWVYHRLGIFLDFCSVFHFSFYHTFAGNTSSEPLMMDCCSAAEKCWICLKIVRKGLALGQKSWCQIICLPTENPCSTEVLSPLLSQWSSSWLETSQLSPHQYNI